MPTERIQPKKNAVNSPRTPQSPWNPTCITDNNGTSSSRSSYESHVKWRGIKSHQFNRKGSQEPFAWSLCRDYLKVFHFNCYLTHPRGTKRKEIIFFPRLCQVCARLPWGCFRCQGGWKFNRLSRWTFHSFLSLSMQTHPELTFREGIE